MWVQNKICCNLKRTMLSLFHKSKILFFKHSVALVTNIQICYKSKKKAGDAYGASVFSRCFADIDLLKCKGGKYLVTHKMNKKYKDRVFRIVFREKKDLLELYNAVNNSNYTNPDELTITTIEDVVYMGVKNDLSFVIDDIMNLYEHQSSFSPNLPLRGLFYFASLYREYIEPMKHRLYSTSPIHIPMPQYIVFYNGTKKEPERQELRLSDLFPEQENGDRNAALECTVIVLNINLGKNRELLEKCKRLKEYAEFIAAVRGNLAEGMEFEEAVELAVDFCIQNGILADILQKNRAEVVDMILTEYDEEEVRKVLKEDAWNEGLIEGTIRTCLKFNISKEEIMQNLMEEFSLSQGEARKYLEEY